MARNQTVWSNQSKNTDSWVGVGRTATTWESNNTKNTTTFTAVSRNTSTWANESVPQVGYAYDSSVAYDSDHTYDFTVFVANQSNNKNLTTWVTT